MKTGFHRSQARTRVRIWASLGLIGMALTSCGKGNLGQTQDLDGIKVSSDVAPADVDLLRKDLDTLKTLDFSNADPEMLRLMQLQTANSGTLLTWMKDRVHFIIDEKQDLDSSIHAKDDHYNYPNTDQLPTIEQASHEPGGDASTPAPSPTPSFTPSATPAGSPPNGDPSQGGDDGGGVKVKTVMLNIGGALYLVGKENRTLLSFDVPGAGPQEVHSARVGILKVGEGLFQPILGGKNTNSLAYVAFRLSTLFHEARHSDGNGKSLAFFHAVCGSGIYKGYSACDRNLNGPYTVEAKFLNSFKNACNDCTSGDSRAIEVLSADSASRQIDITFPPNTPQAVRDTEADIERCKLLTELNQAIPSNLNCNMDSLNTRLTTANNGQAYGVKSAEWDATPESAQ